MHLLITGCAGFIASRVAAIAMLDGHSVTGVDNMNNAYDIRLKEWRLAQLRDKPQFHFQRLDICDAESLGSFFRQTDQFDAIINLAARAGVRESIVKPRDYVDTNITGTLNLLQICHKHDIKKFVLASSSSLYGTHNQLPYKEDYNTDCALSPYAASKKAAEVLCYSYHHLYQIDTTVLRFFTVYGPASRPDMSPFRFVQWIVEGRPVTIYGDGSQERDFTYVDDIARGTLAALRPVGFEIINLGSDHPVKIKEVVHLIEGLTGKTAQCEYKPIHPADVPATWADISRARDHLKWEPRINLQQGFENLVNWYMANREWANSIATV